MCSTSSPVPVDFDQARSGDSGPKYWRSHSAVYFSLGRNLRETLAGWDSTGLELTG